MRKKRVFRKKSNYFTLFNILIIILLFFCILFYFLQYKSENYFVIQDNLQELYIIPPDRGGEKVKNLDNYLIISSKKYPNIVNQFVLGHKPIKIFKLIEKINIEFLKLKFNSQSHVKVKNYTKTKDP